MKTITLDTTENRIKLLVSDRAYDADAIHDNLSGEIAAITEKLTIVDDDLLLIEDSEDSNSKKRIKKSALGTGVTDHGALTGLADDDHTQYLTEARHDALPADNPHSVTAVQVGADPSGSAAAVQGNLDDHEGDTANPHSVTAAQVGALVSSDIDTLAELNAILTDATLDDSGDSRPPTAHNHAASEVNSGTFADARISESSVTQHEAALSITESQISDLDHTDANAIHDNANGEIAALTEKVTPASGDFLIIEDSAASNAKKKLQVGNLPTGGGEANTIANVGTGTSLVAGKSGVELQVNSLKSENSAITVSLDDPNNDVELTFNETAITITESQISDLQTYLKAADIDTLAELNAIIGDATLDDSGDSRTPSAHATSHSDGGTDEITLENLATGAADDEIFKASSGGIVAIDMDALKTLLGLSVTDLAEWIASKLVLAGKLGATSEDTALSGTLFNIESSFTLNPASANSGTNSSLFALSEIKTGNAQNFTGYIYGTNAQINHKGTGTASNLRGMRATVANYSTGTITNAWAQILRIYNLSSGVVTNAYGLVVEIPSGTIANVAGIAVDEQAASTGAVNLLLGTSTIPSGDYSIYNASNKANRFDGALSVMPTSNAFGYASPYIAFIIGDIDTTSPNGSNGGAYTGARYNKSNDPFVILSPWDDGAERYIYYGGGGWNLPDAMAHEFYAAETYNETDDQGVLILRLDFDGATFSKLATFSAGINESAVTDHEAALSITESQISDLGDYQEKDATILSKSANYTVLAADAGKIIECDGTFTITLPDSLDSGFQVVIVNVGSGTITIAASTTLQSKDSNTDLANQYGAATAYHRGSNVWCAFGDLS